MRVSIENVESKKFHVLVVDDFDFNRQILAVYLSGLNVDIDEAESGETAIDCLNRKSYDLILLDIFLPGMSGIELTRLIRSRWPQLPVSILGLTASEAEQDIHEALDAGMDEVILKPVKRADLLSRIGEYLPISAQPQKQYIY